ncbi:MAG: hypothetical protein GF317_13435 [Candidatus Lokiarchaeota archaeon]|nr:hypothetical protein [Candidatus Lokiarchaeota archaeon]MBD3200640.1 hypothetical protein [Candidatus Lokiarchaeota archaeon]
MSFDFDINTQKAINRNFSSIKKINWKNWLEISTKEEYIETILKLSGLSNLDNLFQTIRNEKTDSRALSVNKDLFLHRYTGKNEPILCHTSGTTNSNIDSLKWFHMSKSLVQRLWAPGMQAIFEFSGLDKKGSAVIFVPSRLTFDGVNQYNGKPYLSLYSAEFSQRVMLSIIKPKSYCFYPYRKALDLQVIARILNLEDIAVISAPAVTILKWANPDRFKKGILKSFNSLKKSRSNGAENLVKLIERKGKEHGIKKIQTMLSEKLRGATLVFSISSLNSNDWDFIRAFMGWEDGKEKFTSLYVASEIGPFAASISSNAYEISRKNLMHIFPLTIPTLVYKNKIEFISDSKYSKGTLFVSRMGINKPIINIDTGDVIFLKDNSGLPLISGEILRSSFNLNYDLKFNKNIRIKENLKIKAGHFFSFQEFDIRNSRVILDCIKKSHNLYTDSLLLNQLDNSHNRWELIVPIENAEKQYIEELNTTITKCQDEISFKNALENSIINLRIINENLIQFLKPRKEIVQEVRNGTTPKGILKKWPMYVISYSG